MSAHIPHTGVRDRTTNPASRTNRNSGFLALGPTGTHMGWGMGEKAMFAGSSVTTVAAFKI